MICLTATHRTLIALLFCIMMTAARGQMPPISGGNVRVVQNAKKNAATDISIITDSRVNQFEMTAESNRGDYFIYSSVEQGNGVKGGIYMTAVRQNGRDNSVAPNVGGNTAGPVSGRAYATCGLDFSEYGICIPVFHAQTGAEFNVNVAALYFPYRTVTDGPGWIGGWARNASDNGPITAADSFFSPSISLGTQFLDNGGGSFTLNLAEATGAPALASRHGVLLTIGGRNEDNYSLSRANADGTFSLFVRDNGVAAGLEPDPVAFVYIPADSPGVVAGRVRGNGTQTRGAGSGTFTTTTAGVAAGQVLLTVPGVEGPNDAVLIITAEGGGRRNAGNIVNYEWSGALSGYVVESRHLTDDNANVPALEKCRHGADVLLRPRAHQAADLRGGTGGNSPY
jgi:hypothetical protein